MSTSCSTRTRNLRPSKNARDVRAVHARRHGGHTVERDGLGGDLLEHLALALEGDLRVRVAAPGAFAEGGWGGHGREGGKADARSRFYVNDRNARETVSRVRRTTARLPKTPLVSGTRRGTRVTPRDAAVAPALDGSRFERAVSRLEASASCSSPSPRPSPRSWAPPWRARPRGLPALHPVARLSPRVVRVLGGNPGAFTLRARTRT